MTAGTRAAGLAGALALLIALDVAIAHRDVFAPLVPADRPTTLFASINAQLIDVVRTRYGRADGPPAVVALGNSQMEAAVRPLPAFAATLAAAGAPPGTPALSLCVFATAPTDDEVVARGLGPIRPGLVLIGVSAPDVGTTLAQAREMPVVKWLDVGPDPLVPPADLAGWLDRDVRGVWHLYRWRALLHFLLDPPEERRTPASRLDRLQTLADVLAATHDADATADLLARRATAERTGRWEDVADYVVHLRDRAYLEGLRGRWRGLRVEPLQLDALDRTAAHVRAAGGTPVIVLLPENPWLRLDPEIGAGVADASAAAAAAVTARADAARVPVLDLRDALPPAAFLDLNHLAYNAGDLFRPLADALAARDLLVAPPPQQAGDDARAGVQVAREEDQPGHEEVERRQRADDAAPAGRGGGRPAP